MPKRQTKLVPLVNEKYPATAHKSCDFSMKLFGSLDYVSFITDIQLTTCKGFLSLASTLFFFLKEGGQERIKKQLIW